MRPLFLLLGHLLVTLARLARPGGVRAVVAESLAARRLSARFLRTADFRVSRDGREIACIHRSSRVSSNTVRHLLLDQVLPVVLNLRGQEAIHATAVLVEGAAVPVANRINKVRMLARECAANFPRRAVPLKGIYRLARARTYHRKALRAPLIERLTPRDAMIELIRSSFPLDIADTAMLKRHFEVMRRVASEVPFNRVLIPDDFSALPAVRDAILKDFASQ
jgi:hypothetical protein